MLTVRRRATPPKVLWAVISETIPRLAALIENNEGHIEHMVAVVSPFPPSSSLFFPPWPPSSSSALTLCLPGSPPPTHPCTHPLRQKLHSNFARAFGKDGAKEKGRCQSCCVIFGESVEEEGGWARGRDEKGESVERPIGISVWRTAADPAETGTGESTGLSIVLVSGAFV